MKLETTIKRLKLVRNEVAKNPRFDWHLWGINKRHLKRSGHRSSWIRRKTKKHPCNTLACVAGLTPIALGEVSWQRFDKVVAKLWPGAALHPEDLKLGTPSWFAYMQDRLGITHIETAWICEPAKKIRRPFGCKPGRQVGITDRDRALHRLDELIRVYEARL